MTARILCPDDHPYRWSPDKAKAGEAFASVARALRDEVLPDRSIRRVAVMVGPPGSGKSTTAARHAALMGNDAVIVDACHADKPRRVALVKRIKAAGKLPVAVVLHTPKAVCVARDASRTPPRRVGHAVVERVWRELHQRPPVRSEGWAEIVTVDGEGEPMGVAS